MKHLLLLFILLNCVVHGTSQSSDTSKIIAQPSIYIQDSLGNNRFALDANAGSFQMIQNDTVWYQLTVASPSEEIIQTPDGRAFYYHTDEGTITERRDANGDVVWRRTETFQNDDYVIKEEIFEDDCIKEKVESFNSVKIVKSVFSCPDGILCYREISERDTSFTPEPFANEFGAISFKYRYKTLRQSLKEELEILEFDDFFVINGTNNIPVRASMSIYKIVEPGGVTIGENNYGASSNGVSKKYMLGPSGKGFITELCDTTANNNLEDLKLKLFQDLAKLIWAGIALYKVKDTSDNELDLVPGPLDDDIIGDGPRLQWTDRSFNDSIAIGARRDTITFKGANNFAIDPSFAPFNPVAPPPFQIDLAEPKGATIRVRNPVDTMEKVDLRFMGEDADIEIGGSSTQRVDIDLKDDGSDIVFGDNGMTNWALIGTNPSAQDVRVSASTGIVNFIVEGHVEINNDLNVTGSKNFKIDHPLDPQNKFLVHSCVESNQRLNFYNGDITTDETGYAKVQLPDYFEALNTNFQYNLTVIGTFAHAIVKEEIRDNAFIIMTSQPNVKVSWQVSGVRNDQYAREHPLQVEVEK